MRRSRKGLIAVFMIIALLFIIAIAVFADNSGDQETHPVVATDGMDTYTPDTLPNTPEHTQTPSDDVPEVTENDDWTLPEQSVTEGEGYTDEPITTAEIVAPEDEEPKDEEPDSDPYESIERLLEYYKKSDSDSEPEDVPIEGGESWNYPSYFGGAYINASGELVVMLTEDNSELRDMLCEVCDNDNILFAKADFSYSHLLETANLIETYMEAGRDDGFMINSVIIDDFGNRVIVEISDISEETISLFEDCVTDSASVLFILASEPELP